MKVLFDEYTWKARFFPCIISAMPLFVLWFFLSDNIQVKALGAYLLSLKFYGGVTISVVFLYFYAQVLRITSKVIESKYFHEKMGFPTVYLMTYSDKTFSKNYKDKYRRLIKEQFNIELLDEIEEAADIVEARKRLNEATQLVKLKIKSGYLVLKQNMWYGFVRNLVGGAIYSMIFCIVNIGVGFIKHNNPLLIISSIVLLVVYAGVFFFRKKILVQNAEAYANQLIAEFMDSSMN
ncbi:MAG TPA: hypothetical protein VMX13_03615 [Sedimentisphaerales bacterium]|nr:hypothetical protein [Sedimentisphaerales bacterium]